MVGIPTGHMNPESNAAYPECTGPVYIPSLYSDWPITAVMPPANQRQCLMAYCRSYIDQAEAV